MTQTFADFVDPITFTTVSPTAAPTGTFSAALARVQEVGLTADADPPLQDRKDPLLLNQDTVICAFAPVWALTSEANVQVSPGLTVSRGSRMRVVVPVQVTRAGTPSPRHGRSRRLAKGWFRLPGSNSRCYLSRGRGCPRG